VTHAVHATRDVVISGGKEGKVKFWAIDLTQCLREVEINHPQALSSCVKVVWCRLTPGWPLLDPMLTLG